MTPRKPSRATNASGIVPRVRDNSQNGAHAERTEIAPAVESTDIVETAASAGRFEIFGRGIQATGLAAMLGGRGPFTVFAPTDKAFGRMPQPERDALLANTAELTRVLSYHIVPKRVGAPRTGAPRSSMTATGTNLEVSRVDTGGFMVNEARILKTNIRASNGVIHAINKVLVPR